ncbi:unnamed protein product [Candidula unifasciata]|uniref:Uncharacterized protein n=1 Tax=Candidula unifasciata TaxID=100452 RepID=A0A8S3ZMC7_9EUPU|nr:unnamed protein product [Candidula unifasciata]
MAAHCENDRNDGGNNHDSFLLMSYLDEVQDRVEEFRRKALSLQQDKGSLLAILSQLKDDRLQYTLSGDESHEIVTKIEQLRERCGNVEINIKTSRTPEQESSYLLVNSLVTKLENMCLLGNRDMTGFILQAQGYLNACISDEATQGPIDYKFQGMILGCKLEDQKLVRYRLECLVKRNSPTDLIQQRSQGNSPTDLIQQGSQGNSPTDIIQQRSQGNSPTDIIQQKSQGNSFTDIIQQRSHGDSPTDLIQQRSQLHNDCTSSCTEEEQQQQPKATAQCDNTGFAESQSVDMDSCSNN